MTIWSSGSSNPSNPDSVWSDETAYRGEPSTITIGSVTSVDQGDESVSNSGTPTDAILDFALPIGDTGPQGIQGPAGTITIGTVSTGSPGTDVIIENVGSTANALLNITIPAGDRGITGDAGTITVGSTTTSAAGTSASVENVGSSSDAILNFTIPKGDKGETASLTAGQNIVIDASDPTDLIVKTTNDLTADNIYSPSLVGGIWGALNKIHVQNYSPGLGYLTQNLKRNSDTSWSLDWGVDYGVGVGLDSSNTATYPGINFMGCDINYSGVQPTKALMTPSGNWGFLTTSPTQTIDNAGTTRLRDHLYDSINSNGSLKDVLTRGSAGVVWSKNTSGLVSVLNVSLPDKTSHLITTEHAMTMGATNTLIGSINGSGHYIVPTTGVYDVYIEGRPVIDNINGGIYGYGQYTLIRVGDSSQVVQGEGNFPLNGRIGIWVKAVGLGIPLNAGDAIKFMCNHYTGQDGSGNPLGKLEAHTAIVRFIGR